MARGHPPALDMTVKHGHRRGSTWVSIAGARPPISAVEQCPPQLSRSSVITTGRGRFAAGCCASWRESRWTSSPPLSTTRRREPNCCCFLPPTWCPVSTTATFRRGARGRSQSISTRSTRRTRFPRRACASRALRSVCGEVMSGFANLRTALPMNIRARYTGFTVWKGAQTDITGSRRSGVICLSRYAVRTCLARRRSAAMRRLLPLLAFCHLRHRFGRRSRALSRTMLAYPRWLPGSGRQNAESEQIEELDAEF